MEAKVQHRVLRPDDGIVLMPSGRAIPLLIYGTCACVAKQHGSVNISSANPVDILFAVKVCKVEMVVGGTLIVYKVQQVGLNKSKFSLASHSPRALMKCDLIELPWCEFPMSLRGKSLNLLGSHRAVLPGHILQGMVCVCMSVHAAVVH